MSVPIATNCPEFLFEIDFTNDPTNGTRAYTDVTSDVRQAAWTRAGRNNELQRTEPGTLTAVLNNRHGYYDPGNAASPRYPGVRRMRWCRASAVWAGVTYRRWTGLIETWSQTWPAKGRDATVEIRAVDAMKVLNLFDLEGLSYGAQLTSARVSAVLTSVGITASTVATGESSVVGVGPFTIGASALQHLMDIETTENGLLFAEGDGTIVFQNRNYRGTTASSKTPQETIGDGASDIPYSEARFDLDDAYLWNTAAVTPSGGAEQVATDTVSKTRHFERRLARTLQTASTTEALNCAQFLVQRYGDPTSRTPSVEVIGRALPAKWPVILSAVNSQRYRWRRTAVASILNDVFIERVSDVVIPGRDWRVTFDLSPALDQTVWVLGHATLGVVGTTTRAGY